MLKRGFHLTIKKNEQIISDKINDRKTISSVRNEQDIKQTYNETDTTLNDFYTKWNRNIVDVYEVQAYEKSIADMSQEEIQLLNSEKYFYELEFEKIGRLVMPIIYELQFEDETTELIRIPAEIWRKGESKTFRIRVSIKKINVLFSLHIWKLQI